MYAFRSTSFGVSSFWRARVLRKNLTAMGVPKRAGERTSYRCRSSFPLVRQRGEYGEWHEENSDPAGRQSTSQRALSCITTTARSSSFRGFVDSPDGHVGKVESRSSLPRMPGLESQGADPTPLPEGANLVKADFFEESRGTATEECGRAPPLYRVRLHSFYTRFPHRPN